MSERYEAAKPSAARRADAAGGHGPETAPLLRKRRGPAPEHVQVNRGLTEMPYAYSVEPARSHFPLRLARYAALAETIAEAASARQPERPMRLLDVGAGRGRSLRYTEAFGVADRAEWHGIDLESHRVYKPERWASLRDVNVEDGLPFDDAAFDFAVCEQVLEHLERPGPVLGEMRRVLRPGGRLVAGVPVFPGPIAALRRGLFSGPARALGLKTGHPQTFSAKSFAALIAGSGFKVDEVRGFRIVSGGPFRPFESRAGWYTLNRKIGRAAPGLCIEVQVLATRT